MPTERRSCRDFSGCRRRRPLRMGRAFVHRRIRPSEPFILVCRGVQQILPIDLPRKNNDSAPFSVSARTSPSTVILERTDSRRLSGPDRISTQKISNFFRRRNKHLADIFGSSKPLPYQRISNFPAPTNPSVRAASPSTVILERTDSRRLSGPDRISSKKISSF